MALPLACVMVWMDGCILTVVCLVIVSIICVLFRVSIGIYILSTLLHLFEGAVAFLSSLKVCYEDILFAMV